MRGDDDLVAGAGRAAGRKLWATRLMASVVPRTKMISRGVGGVEEALHLDARRLVGLRWPAR